MRRGPRMQCLVDCRCAACGGVRLHIGTARQAGDPAKRTRSVKTAAKLTQTKALAGLLG